MFHLLQSPVDRVREQLVIAPHHPDRLRRPTPRAAAVVDGRFHQALAWNVFRTLELLPPPFWLRRLQARLGGETLPAASHTLRVHLWEPLVLPPAQRIDGAVAPVVADVVIETEDAVWALMICGGDGTRCLEHEGSGPDPAARMIDAGSWRAGTRPCYVGFIASAGARTSAETLVQRCSRSRDSRQIRSGMRRDGPQNVRGVGVLRWSDLAAILTDCEQARHLTSIERALARNAVTWLERVGVSSPDDYVA